MPVSTPQSSSTDSSQWPFLIVGIGGSAGAIASFREFFQNVPEKSGMAYVVILHLAPEYESHLPDVLQSSARIPVIQVREKTRVEPDRVYVIPPNKSLAMQDGTLVLSDVTSFEDRRAPIDIFFRTLAETHDSRAVCVVMSGSGSDGSMGLRRIKEYNGLVVVQDPAEAAFGEMPRSSISTGLADYVVPVAEMPERILEHRDKLRAIDLPDAPAQPGDDEALREIFTVLRLRTGHDFTNYKRATVLRRIERRMIVRDVDKLPEYAGLLREREDEAQALMRELLISVTNFFRDAAVWDKVASDLIPRLVERGRSEQRLRIWVPGCATGEEAYTIAMLLAEAGAAGVQIFATDLDEHAIARARNAWYSEADVADVSPERLRRFFVKEASGYRIRRDLRETILFAHHNLIKDPPFSHLDFISCRNLLIYLNRAAQNRAMAILHFALEPGGYLLLGTAEAVDGAHHLFTVEDKEAHIYQARPVDRTVPMRPLLPQASAPLNGSSIGGAVSAAQDPRSRERFSALDLHHRLLEQYAPPSVIVDDQYDIVHLSERAGRYLQFSGGEASTNLLQLVKDELRIALRSALFQAAQKRTAVSARGLDVHTFTGGAEKIDLIIRPVLDGDPARGFFLVVFEPARDGGDTVRETAALAPVAMNLEEELLRVKSQMRVTIEQYETQAEEAKASNEELQAMNEELRSTAEELETSQEELQSVNEELQTVNQELKVKIEEITHAGDDLRNLISATDIGTIFVDRALKVKLFTPRARDLFNLIAGDIGRPLLDITHKVAIDDLSETIELVLERLQTIEREVPARDDCWYLMRLVPYRTSEERIDGVVLTFLDVTVHHKAEVELRDSETRLRTITDLVEDLLWSADASGKRNWFNEHWMEYTGQTFAQAAGDGWLDAVHPEDREAWHASAREAIERGDALRVEQRLRSADGEYRLFLITVTPFRDAEGRIVRWFGRAADIHEERQVREGLEERVRERTQELLNLSVNRQQLLERLVTVTEEERQRIARELHDEMGQHITALRMRLESLHAQTDRIDEFKTIITRIDQSIDRLTLELRPPALDQLGLHGVFTSFADEFAATSGIRVALHLGIGDAERFAPNVESTLYRVLQESLTNVWKHAAAKSVSVILERDRDGLRMIIEDTGRGFDSAVVAGNAVRGRFGLLGIRERLALIGGTVDIESQPGSGTTIYVRVPMPSESGA